jgi:hypothetical protein
VVRCGAEGPRLFDHDRAGGWSSVATLEVFRVLCITAPFVVRVLRVRAERPAAARQRASGRGPDAGAVPFSTQSTSAAACRTNRARRGPPLQWPTPALDTGGSSSSPEPDRRSPFVMRS